MVGTSGEGSTVVQQMSHRIGTPLRAGLIGTAGVAAYFAAFALNRMVDGFVGAALFMISLCLAPIAVGMAVAMATHHESGDVHFRATALTRRSMRRSYKARAGKGARCRSCGDARELYNEFWVCVRCDQTPIRFGFD
jgi:hypothetical protein